MNLEQLPRNLRTLCYYAAALAGAMVNVATSPCDYVAPVAVVRTDTFAAGQNSKRYVVRAPRSESIEVSADSGYAVTWVNPPPDLLGDASAQYATFGTSSFKVECGRLPCSRRPCPNPCERFEIEVTRPSHVPHDTFKLTVTSGVNVGCDDRISELEVEPE